MSDEVADLRNKLAKLEEENQRLRENIAEAERQAIVRNAAWEEEKRTLIIAQDVKNMAESIAESSESNEEKVELHRKLESTRMELEYATIAKTFSESKNTNLEGQIEACHAQITSYRRIIVVLENMLDSHTQIIQSHYDAV